MPNYVMNVVTLRGELEEIRDVLEFFRNDQDEIGKMDFNRVLPMPESLNIETSWQTTKGQEAYEQFQRSGGQDEEAYLRRHPEITRDMWILGKEANRNLQKYGAATWYDWCSEHWNTKWNAVNPEHEWKDGEERLRFETAWAPPTPVMERLAELFPDVEFEHKWANEELGERCGMCLYRGGKLQEEFVPLKGKESLEFAAGIWELDLLELGYVAHRDGTGYVLLNEEEYDLINIFGKPALYTMGRFPFREAPEGLYMYDLRESADEPSFVAVERYVRVDHGGSILLKEPLDLGEDGYILLTDDNYPDIVGDEEITIQEFMTDQFDHSFFEGQERVEMV